MVEKSNIKLTNNEVFTKREEDNLIQCRVVNKAHPPSVWAALGRQFQCCILSLTAAIVDLIF